MIMASSRRKKLVQRQTSVSVFQESKKLTWEGVLRTKSDYNSWSLNLSKMSRVLMMLSRKSLPLKDQQRQTD